MSRPRPSLLASSRSASGAGRPSSSAILVLCRSPCSFAILSRARLRSSTLTRGSPSRPKVRPSVCSSTSARTSSSDMPRASATRATWNSAAARRDVRVEAAAGCGDQVDRNARAAGLGAQRRRPLAHRLDQLPAGRREVGAARVVRRVAVARVGRARVEILRPRERLADQRGADDLAVPHDQAAVRLFRKDRLRDAGDRQRIERCRSAPSSAPS